MFHIRGFVLTIIGDNLSLSKDCEINGVLEYFTSHAHTGFANSMHKADAVVGAEQMSGGPVKFPGSKYK